MPDNAMKPTNRANQRTMGTQTTFETHPEVNTTPDTRNLFHSRTNANKAL